MRSKKLVNRYVGECLRRIRIAKSIKVQEVARRAGLPASSYSCLEGGWYNINLDNLFRILQVLEADVTEVWPRGNIGANGIVDDEAVAGLLEEARANQPQEVSVDNVLDAVAEIYGVTREALASGSRKRKLSEARTVAAVLVKEIPQLTLTELAEALNVHISSLSHCTKRLRARADKDDRVLRRAEEVRQKLWEEFENKKKNKSKAEGGSAQEDSEEPGGPRLALAAM